jgi:hypothetical protein
VDGKPAAYVCRQGRCQLPVADGAGMLTAIGPPKPL